MIFIFWIYLFILLSPKELFFPILLFFTFFHYSPASLARFILLSDSNRTTRKEKGDQIGDGEGEDGDEEDRERREPAGDLLQAPERPHQEGLRDLHSLRRRGGSHRLLQPRPPLRVRQLQVLTSSSSSSIEKTTDRYLIRTKNVNIKPSATSHNTQLEATNVMKKITLIESHRRKLLGENLGSCSEEELQELGNQLEESLSQIRKRKQSIQFEQIANLKEKERGLLNENSVLREKLNGGRMLQFSTAEVTQEDQDAAGITEVETELTIGRPGTRDTSRACSCSNLVQ
ncbi:MADS-box protein SOC1-like isoform X2 [Zingiber officinale]|uniref:MADS-box protein SOC1-like isoform X2 n=1 Tax=Zingiber officinale TaxID=94328 RepID=UPI001C4B7EEC|nr:MADS-box protein SOC1-like isoform X2 [Zingiber officinale]